MTEDQKEDKAADIDILEQCTDLVNVLAYKCTIAPMFTNSYNDLMKVYTGLSYLLLRIEKGWFDELYETEEEPDDATDGGHDDGESSTEDFPEGTQEA